MQVAYTWADLGVARGGAFLIFLRIFWLFLKWNSQQVSL